MKSYLDLMRRVVTSGDQRMDRTGVGTRALFFESLSFDMADGFPAVTTKRLFFNSVAAELAGFIHADDNAASYRARGTQIWDANANAPYWQSNPHCRGQDDMGRVYGVQWRRWAGPKGITVDQLGGVLDRMLDSPGDRRLCVTAWNPGELHLMCLPPCHLYFQFFVREGRMLDLYFVMRSVDTFLGMPFDVASYALLLHLSARHTRLVPGRLSCVFGDTHVYLNHLNAVNEQLGRSTLDLPRLTIDDRVQRIDDFTGPSDVELVGYDPHPSIKAPMAV